MGPRFCFREIIPSLEVKKATARHTLVLIVYSSRFWKDPTFIEFAVYSIYVMAVGTTGAGGGLEPP